MATIGTRAHKFGSIYSRVKNMMSSGLIAPENKPMWYDVYEAFPPEREPVYSPPPPPDQFGLFQNNYGIKKILYHEDWARVAVKRIFNDFNSVYDLKDENRQNMSQEFISIFKEIRSKNPDISNEHIFEETKKVFFQKNPSNISS